MLGDTVALREGKQLVGKGDACPFFHVEGKKVSFFLVGIRQGKSEDIEDSR